MNSRDTTKVVDLFCGGGGLSLGACQAGFDVVCGVDYDQDLTASYASNFPRSRLILEDLASDAAVDLAHEISKCSIAGVVGGPPCQGISMIGKRNPQDVRNQMVARFFELVSIIGPRFFVMENVPHLISEEYQELLEQALDHVSEQYVVLDPLVVDAAESGAATFRRRLFLIGLDGRLVDTPCTLDFFARSNRPSATVRDAIEDLPRAHNGLEEVALPYRAEVELSHYASQLRLFPDEGLSNASARRRAELGIVTGNSATLHSSRVRKRFSQVEPGATDKISRYARLCWESKAPVLRAGTGKDRGSYQAARPIHPEEPRVITVREAARLQGFPDWFEFSKTKWHSHRMIGNSVSPLCANAIMSAMRSVVE